MLGILFAIAWEGKVPLSEIELADLWWSSPANSLSSGLPNRELARQLSDRDVRRCLVMFGDSGAWTMQRGKLTGTEIGWDLALVMMSALERGVFGDLG